MPGLMDVHNHHMLAGHMDLFELNVPPTLTLDEFLEAVAAWSDKLAADQWVIGGSWGSSLFSELNTPQALERLDEATGVLLEAAGVIVEQARESLSPTPTSQVAEAAARGMEILHSYGITGLQDAAASLQLMQALKELDESGNLHAWVVTSMQANDFIFGTHPLGEGSLPSVSKPGPPTTALISSRSSSMASRRPVPERSSNRIWKAWVSRSAIAAARPCFQKHSRAG
ncbi:amidohydrolase family protein [Glutamicibacter sp. FR1]|uniref:amidohydrolase family protein n=1 Tax=Glutamicibacter sp. FR1 TaxID=3393744 RepID=UPI0039B00031